LWEYAGEGMVGFLRLVRLEEAYKGPEEVEGGAEEI